MALRIWLLSFVFFTVNTLLAADPVSFKTDIAPILEKHCLKCHSPGINKGDLSLSTPQDLLKLGYVVAGDPNSSYLLDVISPMDGNAPQMPQQSEPLSNEQVALIRSWIESGAEWPDDMVLREPSQADKSWWSLQPLADLTVPDVTAIAGLPKAWDQVPIDRFVATNLHEQGLLPNPPADRRTLIRRATYDLTGLPPTPEQVDEFVNSEDPKAYEKLIDRLLASPRYGERWGRHWLDVVRFGESNGFERNVIIDSLWPFRDYVIESINADKPFDQFIREHLAGDVLAPDNPEVVTGAAFLVCGPYDNVGNQDAVQAAQIRANTIDEIIRASSEAFLGMTVGCARCHDHKFDPIRQADYYRLYATFAGVKHGARVVATPQEQAERAQRVGPLNQQRAALTKQRDELQRALNEQAAALATELEPKWVRAPVDRTGTEESFPAVEAKFVKLVCLATDASPQSGNGFRIDEFEIWSHAEPSQNVALASAGATATGPSRNIEDFPGAYGPQLAIDGQVGARFISTSNFLQIELAQPTVIQRVIFSSARNESKPDQRKFHFVADYRIEVSLDGTTWKEVAHGRDRQPVNAAHRNWRLQSLAKVNQDRKQIDELNAKIGELTRQINAVPPLRSIWVGTPQSIKQPQHIFIGGSPQRQGELIVPASLGFLSEASSQYTLTEEATESERRVALANWLTDGENPLPLRVLANRVWHYHFGTGIVNTPNDFGYMGGRPSHPELLDWLAGELLRHEWKLKPLHREIMLSQTYQQSSQYRAAAAAVDGETRHLWRFPPRRLSAEEIRDTMLFVAGHLDLNMGGPGFRLYKYLQDNVATYVPLDQHGPETYRRAVYHQNARAARTDLMTDFDQPDCAFSSPRRAETTTPLQALSTLNHSFTLDMAKALADRVARQHAENKEMQIRFVWELCYHRMPTESELTTAREFVDKHSLPALCRALLNTSELIYLE